ncbi:hypothetical protein DYQ86_09935 [Acidobacteria bacterium AB60]|nr:hypothetical protein DYQ86_09935 [Acidobacteria bacterium AB60]
MQSSSLNPGGAVQANPGRKFPCRIFGLLLLAGLLPLLLAGCGVAGVAARPQGGALAVSPGAAAIDTNCTGCNSVDAHGNAVLRFAALGGSEGAAGVTWSVSGGDPAAGPGTIDAAGRYTPPTYLTKDAALVQVTAAAPGNPALTARATIALTPGFLQPLTPENVALGPMGTVTLTGRLAQAGGRAEIRFALAGTGDAGSGVGTLSAPVCQHGEQAFTTCSVTYTAPATIAATGATYVVASVGGSKTEAEILLNTAGVNSNPSGHQGSLATLMPLGSSGGNNHDYDARGNTIADCCSGTLGALVQDNAGRQYLLSNNHVLARSDHATVGDAIVQPGLIDNNCTPSGEGPGTVPVAALTSWLPLTASTTNADAAIAQVASRTLDANGSILELGARQADGSLAAAPPGISSSGGKGEMPALQMTVAKSGRTTGLTCGAVTAVDLDVSVDYYRDCAETKPYTTKVFTNQVAVSGDRFSDAGDSGALVVDTANAEPVGLFFAGGTATSGVVHSIANPASEVLSELGAQTGNGGSFTFVGGPDHGVSCLNYGDSTVSAAQGLSLSSAEIARGQEALAEGRALVDPSAGVLGVAMGKSSDHAGEAALLVYVNGHAGVPQTVAGVRTVVIGVSADQVAAGTAPVVNALPTAALPATELRHAMDVKDRVARLLMRGNPAYFGIGVGQSLDDPRRAALVIYVDRHQAPASLPPVMGGVRVRYTAMDRLHVTRSYASTIRGAQHCVPHGVARGAGLF